MRNGHLENMSVEQVVQRFPETSTTLREYGIDRSARMRLRDAAAAASANTDEVLAIVEARMRRAARRNVRVETAEEMEDLMLV
jgi:hypothetical protein